MRGDVAKLQWLRAAAKEGFDALDRGDSVTFRSKKDIKDFLRGTRDNVGIGAGSKRKRRW
jgi:hypothetical protein